MYILGINAYHGDASAALLKDGELIAAVVAAVLRNSSTVLVVVDASVITTETESTTAPSLLLQSTSKAQPEPSGVLKLVAVVRAAVPPIVANECSGRSTNMGCLLLLDVANFYLWRNANT